MPRINTAGACMIILPLLACIGCSSKMSDKERQNISVAYSETLLARNLHREDSTAAMRAADSTVARYGFANEAELMARMKDLTNDPESLRLMLDSAQKRLELIQQGVDPDHVTIIKKSGEPK